jgi:predicted transcriptional regulator
MARNTRWSTATPLEIAERDKSILELHRAGLYYREIAEQHGCSTSTVHKIVHAHVRAANQATAVVAAKIRDEEDERLRYHRAMLQGVIERRHYLAYQGVITDIEDDGPLVQAIREDRQVGESLRKLWGADVPSVTEVRGGLTVQFGSGVTKEDFL